MNEVNESLLADTSLAQWVYNQVGLFRDQSVGPFIKVEEYHRTVFELVMLGWKKVFSDTPTFSPEGVIEVKSPWHAALILEDISYHYLTENERLIFRGHADSNWIISSSISRLPPARRLVESARARVFADILAALSFNSRTSVLPRTESDFPNVRMTSGAYLAAAQHYGIPTNLMDWTPDPAVATFFAAEKSSGKMASVFVMKISDALEHGFEILIPPPFVERLHLQRGLFIRSEKQIPAELCVYEIRFPTDYYFERFQVVRRGHGKVELLPELSMAEELKELASEITGRMLIQESGEKWAYRPMLPDEYRKIIVASSFKIKHHFAAIFSDWDRFWDDYVLHFEDVLFWTCYKELGPEIYLDDEIFKAILLSNRDLSYSVVNTWMFYLRKPELNWGAERIARIKLFVEAAHRLVGDCEGFDGISYFEGWLNRSNSG